MKKALFACLLFFGVPAFAQVFEAPCKFNDYQLITAALDSNVVDADYRRMKQLKGVLILERGPTCHSVISAPLMKPPEYEIDTYIIRHINEQFRIDITRNKHTGRFVYVGVK